MHQRTSQVQLYIPFQPSQHFQPRHIEEFKVAKARNFLKIRDSNDPGFRRTRPGVSPGKNWKVAEVVSVAVSRLQLKEFVGQDRRGFRWNQTQTQWWSWCDEGGRWGSVTQEIYDMGEKVRMTRAVGQPQQGASTPWGGGHWSQCMISQPSQSTYWSGRWRIQLSTANVERAVPWSTSYQVVLLHCQSIPGDTSAPDPLVRSRTFSHNHRAHSLRKATSVGPISSKWISTQTYSRSVRKVDGSAKFFQSKKDAED